MKRHAVAFEELVSSRNLWRAWREYARGKRRRPAVAAFEVDIDRHIVRLQRELRTGDYRPGGYRLVLIREPKTRVIAAAPVRDRVVHHAIHRLLSPLMDRSLVDQTYACLTGRGTHRAVLRFLRGLRSYRHVLFLDMRHYFLSIDHGVLKALLARKLKGRLLLGLLDHVIDSAVGLYERPDVASALHLPAGFPGPDRGLPIGNLTSQSWGNFYLSGLDHYVKRELGLPLAVRYMDDLALFADSRSRLEEARTAIGEWLARERRLVLKHPAAPVRTTTAQFRYLGHQVSRAGIDPSPMALVRMRRRLRELLMSGDGAKLERSIASYRGLLGVTTSAAPIALR